MGIFTTAFLEIENTAWVVKVQKKLFLYYPLIFEEKPK